MKQKRKYIYLLPMILLGIVLFLAGCGRSYAKPKYGPFSGYIKYQAHPATNGTITGGIGDCEDTGSNVQLP